MRCHVAAWRARGRANGSPLVRDATPWREGLVHGHCSRYIGIGAEGGMSSHAMAQRTHPRVNQRARFECGADQAAEIGPSEIGSQRMPDGPGCIPGGVLALPKLMPRPPGRRADRGGAPALTLRLVEILAAMVEAVLDAEDALCATRGKIPIRRPRAPRDRRPAAAKRDARKVQP